MCIHVVELLYSNLSQRQALWSGVLVISLLAAGTFTEICDDCGISCPSYSVRMKAKLSLCEPWRCIVGILLIIPLSLSLGATMKWVVSFTPLPLCMWGNKSQCLLKNPELVCVIRVKNNHSVLIATLWQFLSPPTCRLDTILTELCWWSCSQSLYNRKFCDGTIIWVTAPCSVPVLTLWDLQWTEWHWGKFVCEHVSFLCQ